jgi:hypothetical protein
MSSGGLEPAVIRNLDTGAVVNCLFRPKDWALAKTNTWTPGKAVGKTMQPPKYTSGSPITMSLELVFDTYEATGNRDVRLKTRGLWAMMRVTTARQENQTKKSEPPHVEFRWGRTWSFKAVIQGQNPTSGGPGGYAVHEVKEGETIDHIAFQEYGSSAAWRHLAEANNLDDPSRLQPGQRLLLVPLNT